ncbi:MAG: winged helix-turn-helix transcriptional regulator [Chloroflexi bacterium]|nr:winged helix-turn-helix transcriptional regulator [Chloroflexota bacterium]
MIEELARSTDKKKITEIFRRQSEVCKSLADPNRLMMIHELKEGAKSVTELAERLGLKQSNTSQHLAVLRKAGVVNPQRQGNIIYYSLTTPKIAAACDMVRQVIAEELQRGHDLREML